MNATTPHQDEQDHFAHESIQPPAASEKTAERLTRQLRFLFSSDKWPFLALLAVIAFIPRLLLALQLDVYTDEPIYVAAGNGYFLLLKQLNITSSNWLYNNEHPAFAKLLMGMFIYVARHLHTTNTLFPARLISVLLGTGLVVGIYALGRAPFGRTVALLAALSLAFSPWVAYFSGLAMLDMTMTALITLAYLLLWHAIRHPRLYALSGILIGLAGASKYPAALIVPAIFAFPIYYYAVLRRKLSPEQRPPLPWRWWLLSLCLIPVSFFLADPPIWLDPLHRLLKSLAFSLGHADAGHVTFWAGQVYTHVPPWMILYVLFAKVSAFVTLPALFFILFAVIQLGRFHFTRARSGTHNAQGDSDAINAIASTAFLFFWLVDALLLFSQLTILVGTHYYLPVAPPLFLAGACGLTLVVRFLAPRFLPVRGDAPSAAGSVRSPLARLNWRAGALFALLALALVGPHLLGLVTIPDADGYTSEFFHGENSSLEVMYAGYHDADEWLMAHSKTGGTVGIVGGSATVLWYIANPKVVGKFQFLVTTYGRKSYDYDYLVWPMNLLQRKWGPPADWKAHIVHQIMGGDTIYCVIMARNPSSLLP
jgi:4-amino-4-deoxy-L-arabinose transferase-like glycosyltransferase